MKRKQLNTSKYNFKGIINGNCMYVDKTKEIYSLISKQDGQFFLSRPRRFGKSLTLSTLKLDFSERRVYITKEDFSSFLANNLFIIK